MIPFMKRMRDAPRRGIFLAAGLSLLLFAGCFLILHGTMPPVPRAEFHVNSDCWQLQFAPDSKTLVTGDVGTLQGTAVLVWDVATARLRYTVVLPSLGVNAVRLSPDSRLLTLDSTEDGLRVFDLQTGRELAHWGAASYCQCLGFALDGRYLAIEDVIREKGLIRLWDPRTQTEIGQIEGLFTGNNLPSHGHNLATYTEGEFGKVKIRVWRLPDSGPPVVTKEMLVPGRYAAFTPDLTRFATYIRNDVAQIALWDTATGRRLCSIPDLPDERVNPLPYIYFAVNGRFLVATDEHVPMGTSMSGSRRRVWGHEVTTAWDVTSLPTPTVISTGPPIDFSGDGKWLALPQLLQATLIDVESREERYLRGRSDEVLPLWSYATRLAFSPDSQVLAVAGLHRRRRDPVPKWLPASLHRLFDSPGCVTHFWDTSTGQEHQSILPGHIALFSPDGQTLLTVDEDTTIRLWDLPPRRPLARDLGLSALLWLTLVVLVGVGQVVVRMIFRLGR